MLILAGLGNPEAKYAHNRHNLGFMAVDAIARRWSFGQEKRRFQGLVREGSVPFPGGEAKVLLLKPQTYYNESGRAISEAMRFFKAAPSDIVLYYDEIDLAPGRFRMKTGPSAAGNNGVRSVLAHVGPLVRRARLGTGHPGHKDRVMGFVLSDFAKSENAWVSALCAACADALPLLAAGQDEKYQMEVMRLAPAEKLDPRAAARDAGA